MTAISRLDRTQIRDRERNAERGAGGRWITDTGRRWLVLLGVCVWGVCDSD